MSNQPEMTPAQREFEAALTRLRPVPCGADAMAAAFEAGRRSARAPLRIWRAVAAVLAIGLGASWFVPVSMVPSRPPALGSVAVIPHPISVSPDSSPEPAVGSESSPYAYSNLRRAVLDRGVDALPAPPDAGHSYPARPIPRAGDRIDSSGDHL